MGTYWIGNGYKLTTYHPVTTMKGSLGFATEIARFPSMWSSNPEPGVVCALSLLLVLLFLRSFLLVFRCPSLHKTKGFLHSATNSKIWKKCIEIFWESFQMMGKLLSFLKASYLIKNCGNSGCKEK